MAAELREFRPSDILGPQGLRRTTQEVIALTLKAYLKAFHQFEVHLDPDMPNQGPYFALTSHSPDMV